MKKGKKEKDEGERLRKKEEGQLGWSRGNETFSLFSTKSFLYFPPFMPTSSLFASPLSAYYTSYHLASSSKPLCGRESPVLTISI